MIRVNLKAPSWLALAFAAGLAGCNSNVSPAVSDDAAAASPFVYADQGAAPPVGPAMPAGARCTAEVDKWQALISRDERVGMVDQSVHDQIEGEIAKAQTACAAGQDAAAVRLVSASRSRHGYPPG